MPNTTVFEFGEVVLVPFPFTDQTTSKKRPAVVVSSGKYHAARRDVIVLAVTSQQRLLTNTLDVAISEWNAAGLLKPSVLKPVLATLEAGIVIRRLGKLGTADRDSLRHLLADIIGQ